jgi:hypothetical protein
MPEQRLQQQDLMKLRFDALLHYLKHPKQYEYP